jgi:beta-glucosidase
MTSELLPPGRALAFGTATASYQSEGSTEADGRGRSIWDTFTATPGTIADGSDGSIACGSYERLDDDLELLEQLGVSFYRFSLAWPRIQPAGSGAIEPRGLAYYDRLVDGLLGRGIAPMATLYHWDLPQPLEDAGGWPVRDTALRFADYAAIAHEHLGDRVAIWATLNEPWCSAFLGYAAGIHAPGRTEPDNSFRAAHHLLLGHGLASRRLHDAGADAVGIVLNLSPVWPETAAADGVARGVDAIRNRIWLGPLLDGSYADDLVALAPSLGDEQVVREGDLATIRASIDWLGVNYYTPERIDVGETVAAGVGQAPSAYPGVENLAFRARQPQTAMGWEIEPRGLEELLVDTSRRAAGIPLIVTENGAAFEDANRDDAGAVVDDDRIDYLDTHIAAVERARAAGADVRAYVAWSLIDNFEWAECYRKTFGLVECEDKTLRRIPKASFRWFAAHVAAAKDAAATGT